jgi:hypothetical protein
MLYLAAEGYEVLRLASIEFEEEKPLLAAVSESDDLGMWIQFNRDGESRDFLLRWEYILAVDKRSDAPAKGGLANRKGLG